MAHQGKVLINPEVGRLVFLRTSEDTDGELLEMEVSYLPHSSPPPNHYHPFQEESFRVIQGTINTQIGGISATYKSGDEFFVPPGVNHWMYNAGETEARVNWQTRPALQTEKFFEIMWELKKPKLMQLAVILQEFSREFRPASPPYWFLRILFGLLTPIGKLMGYRAVHEGYIQDGMQEKSNSYTINMLISC
jgi:quercetin dioxygenase-like cupin family protein